MTAPRVVHCKHEPFDVYVGRPSKWGNPFRIGAVYSHGPVALQGHPLSRVEAVQAYEAWLCSSELGATLLWALGQGELRGKTLGCWCAPLPCHADVLLRFANVDVDV